MARNIIDKALSIEITTCGSTVCEPGWQLGPRIIQDHLLYYVDSGVFEATLDAQHVLLQAGTLFWLMPGVQHTITVSASGTPVAVKFFRFRLGRHSVSRIQKSHLLSGQIPGAKERMADLLPGRPAMGAFEEVVLRCRLGELFCLIAENQEAQKMGKPGLSPSQQNRAISFIQGHLNGSFTMDDLAAHTGLNTDYFSRQFKKSTGKTPQAWIKQERIRAAASLLLESNLNITQIAHRFGYDDIYFFSRQFKEVTGMAPSLYRTTKTRWVKTPA